MNFDERVDVARGNINVDEEPEVDLVFRLETFTFCP